jgi:pimeloyl-ACP methyl ester carboxylesterase
MRTQASLNSRAVATGRALAGLALAAGFAALAIGCLTQVWLVFVRQGAEMALLWTGGIAGLGLIGRAAARAPRAGVFAHLLDFMVAAPLMAACIWAALLAAAVNVLALGPHVTSLALVSASAALCLVGAMAAAGFLLAPLVGRHRAAAACYGAAVAVALAMGAWAVMAVEPTPSLTASLVARPPPQMITLATGSRLAVWRRPVLAAMRAEPVVFLHGGPGGVTPAAQIAADAAFVNAAGYEAIFFDQAGSGASGRLPAQEYTLDRFVADLEGLRIALDTPRLVLLGESWGAALALRYAAAHPDRVAGLILLSPGQAGPLAARDRSSPAQLSESAAPDAAFPGRLRPESTRAPRPKPDDARPANEPVASSPAADQPSLVTPPRGGTATLGVRAAEPPIRISLPTLRGRLWDRLMGVNPALADALWPQDAMQGFSDWAYWNSLRAAGQIASLDAPPTALGYSLAVARRISAVNRETPIDATALAGALIPAVIVRGDRDFIPRAAALDYRSRLAFARLVEPRGLGHGLDFCTRMIETARFLLADLQGLPASPDCSQTAPGRWEWSLGDHKPER